MESEIGGMNEEAVTVAFSALFEEVLGCVQTRSKTIRELGGHFVLSLRIDREGGVRWAYLSESTLGDRDTERCVLDLAQGRVWPRPLGGEGLASRSFDVDPGAEPAPLEGKRVRRSVLSHAEQLARCKKGVRGTFTATAYVRPDGRVMAAGVAPPSETGERAADCLAEAIGKMRFASPGRRAAKVTFEVP
jgi:hypothetical protein